MSDDFKGKLNALQLYYTLLVKMIDAKASKYIYDEMDSLHRPYAILLQKINQILNELDFKDIKEAAPYAYPTLSGYAADIQFKWSDVRAEMMKFTGLLEELDIEYGLSAYTFDHDIPESVRQVLDQSQAAIEAHHHAIDEFESYKQKRKAEKANLKLEASSYDAANGVLTMGGKPIAIIKQPKMKGKDLEKRPAQLMRLLFAVNTFPKVVPIRDIFPVKTDTYPQSIIKRADRLVAHINKYIQDEVPVNEVVRHDKFKFYIDNSYLK